MTNIINFTGITKLDLPVDRIIKGAVDAGLTEIVIIGYDKDGEEYFASSIADGGSVLWHLERSKKKLLEIPDDM